MVGELGVDFGDFGVIRATAEVALGAFSIDEIAGEIFV